MTEKLYEKDGHLSRHTATVVSCEKIEGSEDFALILDRTAFFPEGGGQASDEGTIDSVPVTDVRLRGGEVVHRVQKEFIPGTEVICQVDMAVRFPRMQCHSGEHIVSGIINKLYGYNNVGFHMGSRDITIDTDGELSEDELRLVERLANEAVVKNLEVRPFFPTKEEAESISYRSKIEINEGLRLVEIPDIDLCACCAPHVYRTGEIGIIKFLEHIRYKGGSRIHMLCGFRALEDYGAKFTELSRISEMLSAKKEECADAVSRLNDSLSQAEYKMRGIIKASLLREADRAEVTEGDLLFIVEPEFSSGLQELVTAALPKCGGICAAFAGTDGDYTFVMGSSTVDLRVKSKEIMSALSAKGGGSPEMIRGKSTASAEVIRAYFGK